MMERIIFNVTGEPVGKGRPRFYRRGKGVGTYTPDKTLEYEQRIQMAFMQAWHGIDPPPAFPEGVAVKMQILATFGIPKSASKKKATEMLEGSIRPLKKPDADNIAKIVADALNGIAYKDDTQLVEIEVRKIYGNLPRITVNLERI